MRREKFIFFGLPYNRALKMRARNLRKNQTRAESKLWNEVLRKRQFEQFKFLRQKPINNFVVDFYCSKLRLVIELDGYSHNGRQDYDLRRTKILENYGLKVVRYDNDEVLNDIDSVYYDLLRLLPELLENASKPWPKFCSPIKLKEK